jgi:predicted phage tail protein
VYEEELPVTGAAITVGGITFDTWWIALVGVSMVVGGMILARVARRVRAAAAGQ